jgi:hypothetical protein
MASLMENAIFVGLPVVGAVLAVSAIPIWYQNLGATPLVWLMIGAAVLLIVGWGCFILALGFAGL